MGSSSTAARPAPRAPTSRPTAPGPMTTTSPRAPAWPSGTSPRPRRTGVRPAVRPEWSGAGTLDGPAYERWVAGYDVETGAGEGPAASTTRRVCGSSRSWSTARRPGRWPRRCTRRSRPPTTRPRTGRRSRSSAGWPSTPPPGSGRGAGRCRSRSSSSRPRWCGTTPRRAGDPHRHLHLQINARVFAAGAWRGLHSVGVVDSIEAINGIGHAAVMCDPEFRAALAAHGYTLDPETGEVAQLAPYAGAFSARAAQIARNIDRYEAAVAQRAPRRGARPGAAAGLGPSRVGGGPTRQGRARERGRAAGSVGRGAAPARLHPADCRRWSTVPSRSGGSTGTRWSTWCSRGSGRAVGLERRRHPRRGRADHRRRRRRGAGRRSAASWSRTSPTAPSHGVCRCWPATTSPSTSGP